jgi:hypothetical protein
MSCSLTDTQVRLDVFVVLVRVILRTQDGINIVRFHSFS